MASTTYSNTFLAALFSISNVDVDIKNEDFNYSIPNHKNYHNDRSIVRKINFRSNLNKNMRKTHNIGQPQWRGYSH